MNPFTKYCKFLLSIFSLILLISFSQPVYGQDTVISVHGLFISAPDTVGIHVHANPGNQVQNGGTATPVVKNDKRRFHGPGNDNFANATNLAIGGPAIPGTNNGGSLQLNEVSDCQATGSVGFNAQGIASSSTSVVSTVWYKFTAAATTDYYINMDNTAGIYEHGVVVWTGIASWPTTNCPQPLACMDDVSLSYVSENLVAGYGGPNQNTWVPTYSVEISATNGTVYYIQVCYYSATDATPDAFDISVTTAASYYLSNPLPLETTADPIATTYITSCSPSVATIEADGAAYTILTTQGYSTEASDPCPPGHNYADIENGQTFGSCLSWTVPAGAKADYITLNGWENDEIHLGAGCTVSGFHPNTAYFVGQMWIEWSLYTGAGALIECGGGGSNGTYTPWSVSGVACNTSYIMCWSTQYCSYNDCSGTVIYSSDFYNAGAPYVESYWGVSYDPLDPSGCPPPACSVLPIELTSFQVDYEQSANQVVIYWSCASQTNNKLFTVQKTVDGYNWQTVTTQPGAGTTSELMYYNATDENPTAGITYYRLMQTDFDGNVTYSKPQPMDIPSVCSATVYPNPTADNIVIRYSTQSPDPINVRIMDISGHVVRTCAFNKVLLGTNDYEVLTYDLAPGMYVMEVSNSQQTFHLKFAKQ